MSHNKIFAIDVETRNEGFDVKKDNRELLSCQIGNDKAYDLFHKNSSSQNFDKLKENLEKMIGNDVVFVGYYIEFDLENLRKFLGITIPEEKCIDIMSIKEFQILKKIKGTDYIKLEDACKHFGIDVSHKELMNKLAEDLKSKNPHWKDEAINYIKLNGWMPSENEVINRIKKKAFGVAISKSYDDFSKSDDKNSTFYKYAIGDIICEFKLFKKLKEMGI